jgi:prepilin-type N-terminal cleavage/methylation domain-containing protein
MHHAGFTMIEVMVVVLVIAVLLAIAVPNFARAREQGRARSCSGNLRHMEWAGLQYSIDKKLAVNSDWDQGTWDSELVKSDGTGYLKSIPTCPSSGLKADYTFEKPDSMPTCANSDPAKGYLHTGIPEY